MPSPPIEAEVYARFALRHIFNLQGMNEILGPIYYAFATDPDRESATYAEADGFYCFTNLMAEIRDNFIKSLDNSMCGIGE